MRLTTIEVIPPKIDPGTLTTSKQFIAPPHGDSHDPNSGRQLNKETLQKKRAREVSDIPEAKDSVEKSQTPHSKRVKLTNDGSQKRSKSKKSGNKGKADKGETRNSWMAIPEFLDSDENNKEPIMKEKNMSRKKTSKKGNILGSKGSK